MRDGTPDPTDPTDLDPTRRDALAPHPAALAGEPVDPRPEPIVPAVSARPAARYEPRAVLGVGGMGEVRLCKDHWIGREVALKVAHAHKTADRPDEVTSRFLREARLQGQLEHPSIVPVYDVGADPSTGEPYFTMKRVRGRTLAEVLRALARGDRAATARFSRRRLLTAFSTVCLAVDYAHARGVVHRDLKPANVMLGDFGEVYVLDWGVAKVALAGAGVDAPTQPAAAALDRAVLAGARTETGEALGTPGYMAPEQIAQPDRIDGRADVYALGAILFELLTLERLHAFGEVPGVLFATLQGVDARPSVRAPGRDVPPELEALCVRATARDPAERASSARELSEAVERYLDGDRDAALRRERAAAHARAAHEAAARAFNADDLAARQRASEEVGRALAFDPGHAVARRVLMRLLAEPPRAMPPAAEAAYEAGRRALFRSSGRHGAAAMALQALLLVAVLLPGLREPGWLAVFVALFAFAVVSQLLDAYGDARSGRYTVLGVVALAGSHMVLARVAGPLVLVPAVTLVATVMTTLRVGSRLRAVVAASGVAAVALPGAVDLLGVGVPAYRFSAAGMQVVPRLCALDTPWVYVALLATQVLLVVFVARVAGRLTDARATVERTLYLQRWQLEALAPQSTER